MQAKKENESLSTIEKLVALQKPLANVAVSAAITTAAVSCLKIPSDRIIQELTKNPLQKLDLKELRTLPLMAGLFFSMRLNYLRSAFTINSKNVVRPVETEHDFFENHKSKLESLTLSKEAELNISKSLKVAEKVLRISSFSAIESIWTQYIDQATVLEQQGVSYNKNRHNFLAQLKAGLGLRFVSSAVNLICLTHLQSFYVSQLGPKASDSFAASLLTGALSGATAAVITYPLKQIQTQLSLSGKVDLKTNLLHYDKTSDLIRKNYAELKNQTLMQIIKDAAPKLGIRMLQSSLVFSAIVGCHNLIGDTPAETAYNKLCSSFDRKY